MNLKHLMSLILAVILLFCGCAESAKGPSPVTSEFSSDVEINYDDNIYKGKVYFNNSNDFKANFTYPEIVSGLEIVYNTGETKVTYKGLDFSGMYDMSALNMLSDALKNLETNPVPTDEGEYDYDKFEIKVNDKGFITEIDFDDIDLKVIFKNQQLI